MGLFSRSKKEKNYAKEFKAVIQSGNIELRQLEILLEEWEKQPDAKNSDANYILAFSIFMGLYNMTQQPDPDFKIMLRKSIKQAEEKTPKDPSLYKWYYNGAMIFLNDDNIDKLLKDDF